MTSELVKVGPEPAAVAALEPLAESARDYISRSKAENTKAAYLRDWLDFEVWCRASGSPSLPASPETLVLYLTALADGRWVSRIVKGRKESKFEKCKVSTISRRVVAVNAIHKAKGVPSPTTAEVVRKAITGIRRTLGTARNAKSPTLIEDIRRFMAALPAGAVGVRDRALLLICFSGAFRRSEVVGLNHDDCEFKPEGLVLTLRRSKTDQEGAGRKIAIHPGSTPDTCPVRALRAWLDLAGITEGPLFRRVNRHGKILAGRLAGQGVARRVKRYAAAVGLDAAKYSGHSLRAGHATAAAINGVEERSIMNQTGHKSLEMVRTYIRDGNLFRDNSSAKLGL